MIQPIFPMATLLAVRAPEPPKAAPTPNASGPLNRENQKIKRYRPGRQTTPLTGGHVLLQAEDAEIPNRNITLAPLGKANSR